jgi:hypothetical protein
MSQTPKKQPESLYESVHRVHSEANAFIGEAKKKHSENDPLVKAVEKLSEIAGALIGQLPR